MERFSYSEEFLKNPIKFTKDELRKQDSEEVLREKERLRKRRDKLEELRQDEANLLLNEIILIKDVFHIAGVYMLFKEEQLVYIGESACITTRISQHLETKEFDSYKIAKLCSDPKQRKRTERSLIKRYRPILNMIHNKNMK